MQSVSSNAVAQALDSALSPKIHACASVSLWQGNGTSYPANTNKALLGAYEYMLLDFESMPTPSGYHKEFILSAQISTDNSQQIRVRLNNIATSYGNTWSAQTFRRVVCSSPFRVGQITLEPTLSYPYRNGTNLYVQTDSGEGHSYLYDVSLTCFLVKGA